MSTVIFNEGDQILVTEENIEYLRKALKNTNFYWLSGHQIVDDESASFRSNKIIYLYEQGSYYCSLNEYNESTKNTQVIHYAFVDY